MTFFLLEFCSYHFFDGVSYRSDSLSENFSLKEAVMGALRDRMIEERKLRNFSAATQKTYVYAVTRLAKYYGKAPDQLGKEEIRAFRHSSTNCTIR